MGFSLKKDGRQVTKFVGSFPDMGATPIKAAKEAEGLVKTQKREGRPLFNLTTHADLTFSELCDWYKGLVKVKMLKSFQWIEMLLSYFFAFLTNGVIYPFLREYCSCSGSISSGINFSAYLGA